MWGGSFLRKKASLRKFAYSGRFAGNQRDRLFSPWLLRKDPAKIKGDGHRNAGQTPPEMAPLPPGRSCRQKGKKVCTS